MARTGDCVLNLPSVNEAGAVAWGCFNLGLIILFSFGASLLAVRGMSMQDAASVTSIALWIAILSLPVGGYLLQRSTAPRLLANLSYLAAGLAVLTLHFDTWSVLACVAFGLALGPGPGALTAMPSRVLRPEHRITGLAIFATLNAAIMGIGPMVAGMLADAAHSPAATLMLGIVMMVPCVPLTILFEPSLRRSLSTGTQAQTIFAGSSRGPRGQGSFCACLRQRYPLRVSLRLGRDPVKPLHA
jgi:hypothetical protein